MNHSEYGSGAGQAAEKGDVFVFNKDLDMTKIADSLQLDSGTFIASLERGSVKAVIDVHGDVCIRFSSDGTKENEDVYMTPGEFPEELARIVADGSVYTDQRADVQNNNWFDLTVWENGYMLPDDYVVDVEKMAWEEIRHLLEDYIDDYIGQKEA